MVDDSISNNTIILIVSIVVFVLGIIIGAFLINSESSNFQPSAISIGPTGNVSGYGSLKKQYNNLDPQKIINIKNHINYLKSLKGQKPWFSKLNPYNNKGRLTSPRTMTGGLKKKKCVQYLKS